MYSIKALTHLLIVSCFTTISGLECQEKNQYNLTGLAQVDGAYVRNGLKFGSHQVFYKEIGGINYTYGCGCTHGLCYVKCCPLGYIRKTTRICIPETAGLVDRVKNGELSLHYMNSSRRQLDVKDVNLLYGIKCGAPGMYKEEKWYLQEDVPKVKDKLAPEDGPAYDNSRKKYLKKTW